MTYSLVSFSAGDGARTGLVVDNIVYDLAQASGHDADSAMLAVLADWPAVQNRIRAVVGNPAKRADGCPLASVKLRAPLPVPGTLFCAGANYSDHVIEMAKAVGIEPDPDPHTLGLKSWHFIKSSRSVIGPDDAIEIPNGSKKLDWEVELAAVIGRKAKNVSIADALGHVAFYTIAVDLSARDFSRRDGIAIQSPFRFDWVSHKSFDTACPLGPCLTPADQIPDPQDLKIMLSVNGTVKQGSSTRRMIFTVAEQIADLSSKLTLWPGDVILTGTPSGVGAATGQFLKSGDVVIAGIENIGELRNRVA